MSTTKVPDNMLESAYASASATTASLAALDSAKVNKAGDTITGTIAMSGALLKTAKGANITAASITDLAAATGNVVDITGNTTITGFGTIQAGTIYAVRFTGTPVLTYNATQLILPGAANIQAAAGDTALLVSLGGGNFYCQNYTRANAKEQAKAWVKITGGASAFSVGFNISSVSRASTGIYTINFTTPFATSDYVASFGYLLASGVPNTIAITAQTVSSITIKVYSLGVADPYIANLSDPTAIMLSFFGSQ